MKLRLLLIVGCCWLLPLRGAGQDVIGVIEAGVTRVIRAVDLQIQRLQTKTVVLQEAQKLIENTLSALSLDEIGSWVQAQKDLYDSYFQELWTVKNVIATYRRIDQIIERQEQILTRYGQIKRLLLSSGHLRADEIGLLERSCAAIVSQSASNLAQLMVVVQSFQLQTTDEQRKAMIDQVAKDEDRLWMDADRVGNQAALLEAQRGWEAGEIDMMRKLYGL